MKKVFVFISLGVMALGAGLMVGCEPKHDVAQVWSYDESGHWHECGDCENIFDFTEHSLESVEAKEATPVEVGYVAHQKCQECEYLSGYQAIPYLSFQEEADFSKEYDGEEMTAQDVENKIIFSNGFQPQISFYNKNMEGASPKDAGEYVVKVNIPAGINNSGAEIQKEFTISPKQVTLNTNFEYNGKTIFTKTLTQAEGLATNETLSLSVTFDSKNVGANVTETTITGEGKENYSFTSNSAITPKPVLGNFTFTGLWADKTGIRKFYTELNSENGLIEGDVAVANVEMESYEADAPILSCYVDGTDGANYSVTQSQFDVNTAFRLTLKNGNNKTLSVYVIYGENKVYSNLLCTIELSSISNLATTGTVYSIDTNYETGVSNALILADSPNILCANVVYNSNGDKLTDENGNWLIPNGLNTALLTFSVDELLI